MGQRTLLFLSRLHPKKGADLLIEAFAGFSTGRNDVTLVIAGGDAGSGYQRTLSDLAARLGVAGKCRFIGEVRGIDKFDILLGADVFVLPSRSEGLPVAVLEALAATRPVIVTKECNLPEVADYDAGEVVQGDIDSITRALARMLDRPRRAEAMGLNGRRLVSERFTWSAIARRTIEAYGKARAGHR